MKGATPSGPIACTPRSANESTTACAGTGRREKRLMSPSGNRVGRYWEPIPTAIARSTPPVTSSVGSPQAVKSRAMTSQASANESERKKIQRLDNSSWFLEHLQTNPVHLNKNSIATLSKIQYDY